jgi:hypothetical protein
MTQIETKGRPKEAYRTQVNQLKGDWNWISYFVFLKNLQNVGLQHH